MNFQQIEKDKQVQGKLFLWKFLEVVNFLIELILKIKRLEKGM